MDGFLLTHPVWDVTEMAARFPSFCSTFLLTHPVWDVTGKAPDRGGTCQFLLTHPVWDVTLIRQAESELFLFLLTHPVWDVTKNCKAIQTPLRISTHTSRVGCDD